MLGAFLVAPVRRNAIFRALVHIGGADLHFERAFVIVNDSGVQGLVEVVLGGGNVIIELTRDRPPVGVDDAQGGVAGGHIGHDQAHGAHIPHQVEGFALLCHFFVDRINMFGPPTDFHLDVVLSQQFDQVFLDGFDLAFAVRAPLGQLFGDLFVFLRVDVTKGQVFEFPLDLPDTQAIGERRKNVERFLRDALAFVLGHVAEGTHVVQAVCQLDEHHAHIVAHGEEGLAQGLGNHVGAAARLDRFHYLDGFVRFAVTILGVLVAAGNARQVGQLGDAVHQDGDGVAKIAAQVFEGDGSILNCVMQKSRRDDFGRDAHFGQDTRHGQAVIDVRFARGALLFAMGLLRHSKGALNKLAVRKTVVFW